MGKEKSYLARFGISRDAGCWRLCRIRHKRHTFVVHRMLAWYREGVDVQARLPYLWTYLGHRDLHSTIVYLTVTQELLQEASERFRKLGAALLQGNGGQA